MEDYDIAKKAAYELTAVLRTVKKQTALLRNNINFTKDEKEKLIKAMSEVEEQFKLFKI